MAKEKQNFLQVFMNGLITENPSFTLMLGMCPTLAITTAASNGIGMGLATTFVLVCSNLFISLLRKVIPDKVRMPAFIVVIASFVTMYIPLIVVNCIIFARAEAFAFKNGPVLSLADGLGMGLGFTGAITILSAIRELFGAGTIFGVQIMPEAYQPMGIMLNVPGGFVTLGLLLALVNVIKNLAAKKSAAKKEELA